MATDPTFFQDDPAVALRAPEVPNASFAAGCNVAASCAPGIGINQGGGAIVGTPEQFTLLDQFGNARAAQKSQLLGGTGYSQPGTSSGEEGTAPNNVVRYGTNQDNVNGAPNPDTSGDITVVSNSTLNDIAIGWVAAT